MNDDGSLTLRAGLTIPAEEIEVRVTTSGGPGGQHANRSLTRVVASLDVRSSSVLSARDRELVEVTLGPIVRSSAGRFRSQRQNRDAAFIQLGQKLIGALTPAPPRRPTKPTRGSKERRLDDKRARSRLKEERRRVGD